MPRTYTEWFMAILLGLALFLIGAHTLSSLLYAGGIIAFLVALGIYSYHEIPADPPSFGVPMLLGERYPEVLTEGWVFYCEPIEEALVKSREPENLDLPFDKVSCILSTRGDGSKLPGGLVDVKEFVRYIPDLTDPERTLLFLTNGGREKINQTLKSILGQATREEGKNTTWHELIRAKERLSVKLIGKLTDLPLPDLRDDKAIKMFLVHALKDGVPDNQGLGIRLLRVDVTDIDAAGDLQKAQNAAAAEELERAKEERDLDTAMALAHKVVGSFGYSQEDFKALPTEKQREVMGVALEIVRIERGRSTEHIFRASGDMLGDINKLLRALSRGASGRNSTGKDGKQTS